MIDIVELIGVVGDCGGVFWRGSCVGFFDRRGLVVGSCSYLCTGEAFRSAKASTESLGLKSCSFMMYYCTQ